MLPREKAKQLSYEFDRTGTCQTCEENNLFEDYGMCPQMVFDSVKFHINEVLELLNSLESKEDIEKAKKFYYDCLTNIPY